MNLQSSQQLPSRSKKIQLGADDIPAKQWRHFHKITPLSQVGTLWFVLLVAAYNFGQSYLQEGGIKGLLDLFTNVRDTARPVAAAIIGGLLLITAAIVIFSFVSWKKKAFALVESGIHFRSGILMKQHTQMRWDRVQSVEIQQKLLGRIFGFGTVTVESAGNDDDLALGLLKMRDAAALRSELLGVVNRVRSGLPPYAHQYEAVDGYMQISVSGIPDESLRSGGGVAKVMGDGAASLPQFSKNQGSFAQTADGGQEFSRDSRAYIQPLMLDVDDLERDELVYELPVGRMIASYLLNWNAIGLIVLAVAAIVGVFAAVFVEGAEIGAILGFLAALLPVIGIIWGLIKGAFVHYGTKLYISSNGLRKRSGLTKLTTSTYPPHRIHAISVSRTWLWKKAGWWKIRITKAGALGSVKGSNSVASTAEDLAGVLVPAATREEMLRILWVLLPGLGSENDAALLEEAFEGRGAGQWFTTSPRSARLISPIDWQCHGLALTPSAMIVRKKRFGREVQIILQDHTQSLHLIQGPIARRCKVATLRADLVLGSVKAKACAVPADKVWSLLIRENELARQARAVGVSESLAEWKTRVGVSEGSNTGEDATGE